MQITRPVVDHIQRLFEDVYGHCFAVFYSTYSFWKTTDAKTDIKTVFTSQYISPGA